MSGISGSINALVEGLKKAHCHADLKSNLEDWKTVTGLDWYLFAMNRSKSMQVSEHIILTNYPPEWMHKYESEKLFQIDPVVKHVMNHQNPIFWDSFKDLDGYSSPEQNDFIQLAASFGLVAGCSIPCNSYGNFAVFSMSDRDGKNVSRMNEYLPYNHFYGNQLLECVLKIDVVENNQILNENFTKRETECLFWGSEGKTAWEISKILGISERTVVFHFTRVTKKLNASSRQHAISKALLHGIVKPSV